MAFAARADDVQDASQALKAGQHQQALERVNKVLAAKPRDPQARFLKGLILTEQGKTKDAIEIFTKLTQDYPELPEPYNNLAVIYASQGQYDKARDALEQSIRTHPSYATAYENLGDVYAKLASQAYDKALQIDSSNTRRAEQARRWCASWSGGRGAGADRRRAASRADAPKPRRPRSRQAGRRSRRRRTEARRREAAPRPKPRRPTRPREVLDRGERLGAGLVQEATPTATSPTTPRTSRRPAGESRADWEKSRRARIAAPEDRSRSASSSPKVTMSAQRPAPA